MPNYVEESKSIEVPAATGVPGYLKVISEILELGRVQEIVMRVGTLSYRRFRREDEPAKEIGIDLETLMPGSAVRAKPITELNVISDNAAVVVAHMFSHVSMDGLNPIAFVGGLNTAFRAWHARSTTVVLRNEEVYGLPLFLDRAIPDEAFLLCAAYTKRGALVDLVRSYKITIPIPPRMK